MDVPTPRSLDEAFAGLQFLPDRTPEIAEGAFSALVTPCGEGGVFVAHYAGNSEWERHPVGDEIVAVVEGQTTMFLLIDGEEVSHTMGAGELIVVPRSTWHRFESAEPVKVITFTPQPTEHQVERPT